MISKELSVVAYRRGICNICCCSGRDQQWIATITKAINSHHFLWMVNYFSKGEMHENEQDLWQQEAHLCMNYNFHPTTTGSVLTPILPYPATSNDTIPTKKGCTVG